MSQQLLQLLNLSHEMLDQVVEHPHYQELIARGFEPGETSVLSAQWAILFLHFKITKFAQSMDNQKFSDVVAKSKTKSTKKIAEYVINECEKQGISLANLILGIAQAVSERGFSGLAVKLLEDASKECQEG